MYQIEKTAFGSRVVFGGTLTLDEARAFANELATFRAVTTGPRSTIVDIRTLIPPSQEVVDIITSALTLSGESGLSRAAIIVSSPVIKGQAIQIAFRAGAVDFCRYFNASKLENWEELSLNWVVNGVEPDVPATTARIRITGY